jgi:hypothetical protein
MSDSSKQGIGQARIPGGVGAATNNGQRQIRGTAGDIGQPSGGEQNYHPVPASRPDADISTTTGAAENAYERAHNHGKR